MGCLRLDILDQHYKKPELKIVHSKKRLTQNKTKNNARSYYVFGMLMPGRQYNSGEYRFGFNGKENDREYGAGGLTQDYGFRLYNPALGKFLSVDPLTKSYPWYTPYQFAGNMPIIAIDLDGLEPMISTMEIIEPPKKVTNHQILNRVTLMQHAMGYDLDDLTFVKLADKGDGSMVRMIQTESNGNSRHIGDFFTTMRFFKEQQAYGDIDRSLLADEIQNENFTYSLVMTEGSENPTVSSLEINAALLNISQPTGEPTSAILHPREATASQLSWAQQTSKSATYNSHYLKVSDSLNLHEDNSTKIPNSALDLEVNKRMWNTDTFSQEIKDYLESNSVVDGDINTSSQQMGD